MQTLTRRSRTSACGLALLLTPGLASAGGWTQPEGGHYVKVWNRFVSGERSFDAILQRSRRHDLVAGQRPIAVVLGCSDSRVPVEILFDQGLGDLFRGYAGGEWFCHDTVPFLGWLV